MIIKAIETVTTIMLIIGVGILISYLNWYGKEDKDFLSNLIINISVPAVIIQSFAPLFGKGDKIEENLKEKVQGIFKNLLSIPLITLFISILLAIIGVKLPNFLLDTVTYLANMSTPLSLIFIGGVLYEVGFRNIKIERDDILVILLRFIISPIIMFYLAKKANFSPLTIQVLTLQAGMPPMTQLGVIASSHKHSDEEFLMTNISLLTILSLIFIPIYIVLMPKFL